MKLLYYLLWAILFYIIWKFVKVIMRYLGLSKSSNPDIKGGKEFQSKYKNIEDAKYTEIKDEEKGKD